MIYYFSATGNSRHTANRLGELLGLETEPIRHGSVAGPNHRLIVVTPVYFWHLPILVEDFLRRSARLTEQVAVIFTSGGSIGSADHQVRRVVPEGKVTIYHHEMVSAYTILHDLPPDTEIAARLDAAEQRLSGLATAVTQSDAGYRSAVYLRPAGWLMGLLFNLLRKTNAFAASARCDGCGVCVRVCPDRAIRLEDGRPVWSSSQCQHCLGCLHHCPQSAIDYGKTTRGKKRYVYPHSRD